MADIFLSYAREDTERAKQVAAALEGEGWSVWYDRAIRPGLSYDEVLERELREARAVVVLWSKASVGSRWVKVEATEAADTGTLIPVLLEPDVKVPMAFKMVQCADLCDWTGADPTHGFWQLTMALTTLVQPSRQKRVEPPGPRSKPKLMVTCARCGGGFTDTFMFCPRCGADRAGRGPSGDSESERIRELLVRALESRYDVGGMLGRGGTAYVFLARDREQKADVAVKVYPPALMYGIGSDRFRRAAQISRTIQHPALVPVWTAGISEDIGFFVMRYMRGGNLHKVIQSAALRTPERLVTQLLPIADALAVLHENDVVHRDIKPSNILIDENGEMGLSDLGLAKLLGPEEDAERGPSTDTGQMVGTPQYFSPEQVMDQDATPASDQFSFGITMYQSLTGQLPFRGNTPPAIMIQILHDKHVPIRKLAPGVPRSMADVVERMLEKAPEKRFSSMREVYHALQAALIAGDTGNGEQRAPTSLWERMVSWLQRS